MSIERNSRRRNHSGRIFSSCCLLGFLIVGVVGDTGVDSSGGVVDDYIGVGQNAKRSQQQPNSIMGDSKVLTHDLSTTDKDEVFYAFIEQQELRRQSHLRHEHRDLGFFSNKGGSVPSTNSPRAANPTTAPRGFFPQRSVTTPAPTPAPVRVVPKPVATSSPAGNVFNHSSSPQPDPTPTPRPVVSTERPISPSQKPQSPSATSAPARPTPETETLEPTPDGTSDGTDTSATAP